MKANRLYPLLLLVGTLVGCSSSHCRRLPTALDTYTWVDASGSECAYLHSDGPSWEVFRIITREHKEFTTQQEAEAFIWKDWCKP